MKQVTAVEYLLNELGIRLPEIGWSNYGEEIQRAKEMEKQQIENAFNESRLTHPMIGFKHNIFEEYYNETFKSEKWLEK